MSPNLFGQSKQKVFTFYTPRPLQFWKPQAEENFAALIQASKEKVGSGKSLVEMFPEDTRQGVNRKASNYHSLNMLYKDPSVNPDDREMADGVLVYETEPSPIPGYHVCQVPGDCKKDAKFVFETLESLNPPVKDPKNGTVVKGAYQDTTYSLKFDDVPDSDPDYSQLVKNHVAPARPTKKV